MVRGHADGDEQVPRGTAVPAGLPPPGDADALAVVDAGGDADLDLSGPLLHARPPAPGTSGTGR